MKTEVLEIFEKELKEKNLHLQIQKEMIKSLKETPIEEEHNIQIIATLLSNTNC